MPVFPVSNNETGAVVRFGPTGGLPEYITLGAIPEPVARVSGNATRTIQSTYEGAAYRIPRRIKFNRVICRLTHVNTPATLSVLIYQAANGDGQSIAALKATCSLSPSVNGNHVLTVNEGDVILESGTFYILVGKASGAGSVTQRTYTVNPLDLITDYVDTDTHPACFTTAIAASTTPSTFDPRNTPTGQAAESSLNVAPIIRLKQV